MIVDISTINKLIPVSLVPFLIIELFVMMMCRMDCKMICNPSRQLKLLINFVQQKIILFSKYTVAVCEIFSKNLKS